MRSPTCWWWAAGPPVVRRRSPPVGMGAEVVLVERYNHLGGLSTGGLVVWIDRMTDWTGQPVITGFASEVLDRLPASAVAGAPQAAWGSTSEAAVGHWGQRLGAFRGVVTWSPLIDPEWLKLESVEMLAEAGVRLLLHSWVVDVVRDSERVTGVVFESKQGRRALLARVVVDCSGDLDVCRQAGAAFEADAEGSESNVQHCLNTAWTWGGVDFKRWIAFKRGDPDAHRGLMERARDALGYVERPVVGWRDDVAVFMGPRLRGYSGLDVGDLTRVEIQSRRRMAAHLEWFRRHAPGFEHAWLMLSAPQVGVRHTGRLVGQTKLVAEDWKQGVRHPDEIGVSPSPSQRFANVSVPYRSLVPVCAGGGAGGRAPHRLRRPDPGVHARDPPVLGDRAGGRRGRGAGRRVGRMDPRPPSMWAGCRTSSCARARSCSPRPWPAGSSQTSGG